MDGDTNLRLSLVRIRSGAIGVNGAWSVAYLPPTKCRPLKCFTNGFGAVRLTRVAGIKVLPSPEDGGPFSISQEEGASTEVTGILVS